MSHPTGSGRASGINSHDHSRSRRSPARSSRPSATRWSSVARLGQPGRPGKLESAFELVLWLALLALWVGFARGAAEPARLARYSAACVCAFVVFGKVLSPQFLIWLVPLVPLGLGAAASSRRHCSPSPSMTEVWFPDRYYSYVYQGSLAWLVFTRDLVLLFGILAPPGSSGRSRCFTLAHPRPGEVSAPFE